jgi:hypothetical protein
MHSSTVGPQQPAGLDWRADGANCIAYVCTAISSCVCFVCFFLKNKQKRDALSSTFDWLRRHRFAAGLRNGWLTEAMLFSRYG